LELSTPESNAFNGLGKRCFGASAQLKTPELSTSWAETTVKNHHFVADSHIQFTFVATT
jgi:hypothetical protein